jgi:catechol 2,3-dioxygenase-like lactoylglutathione lyase family enzyme
MRREKMKVEKIDHIGIAVESIESWIGFYRDILGLDYTGSE